MKTYAEYTEKEQAAFIEGWEDAGGYTGDLNGDNPRPWCCPWYYIEDENPESCDPYTAGGLYWDKVKAEVKALLEEEE